MKKVISLKLLWNAVKKQFSEDFTLFQNDHILSWLSCPTLCSSSQFNDSEGLGLGGSKKLFSIDFSFSIRTKQEIKKFCKCMFYQLSYHQSI